MTHRRAFTLIELLVVIAIIAILAAILFPVFTQAKLAAKKTVALSNAKQIATGNMIYQGDFDDHLIKEFFGFPADGISWGSTYYNWKYALQPYLKSTPLLQDPTNNFREPSFWTEAFTNGNPAENVYLPSNYATNNHVIGFANGNVVSEWTPEGLSSANQLDDVAGTIIIVPNRSQWNDLKIDFGSQAAQPQNNGWCITPRGGSAWSCPPATDGAIHSVGKQVSFIWADGHAKAMGYSASLRTGDANFDNWYAYNSVKPATGGQKWTQADRVFIQQTLYPEYR